MPPTLHCDNPTPSQFCAAFRKLLLNLYLESGKGNCYADSSELVTSIKSLSQHVLHISSQPEHVENIYVAAYDYQKLAIPEQNSTYYVAGYIMAQCLKQHSCETCLRVANNKVLLENSAQLLCYFKAYDKAGTVFGGLMMPDDSFINFICCIHHLFLEKFLTMRATCGIGKELFKMCSEVPFTHPCSKFPKQFAIQLFIRMMIHHTLKRENRAKSTSNGHKKKLKKVMHI